MFLLAIAAYAFYVGRLEEGWNPIYALTVVGVLFLNILITTTQTFLHVPALNAMALTEQSLVYVAVKIGLLCVFVVVAIVAAWRAGGFLRE